MSAFDRLSELRRQRALVQQHLEWLDREIAAAETAGPKGPAAAGAITGLESASPSPSTQASPEPPRSAEEIESRAESLMEEYRVSSHDVQRNVKKGCLLYFGAAFVLLVLTVLGLYFALRH